MTVTVFPKQNDFYPKKVLLIDDNVRIIFAITLVLELQGMEVVYAKNGKLGIETLKDNPDVEVILMDIIMPEMNGIEATQEIRKLDQYKEIPIITLTAKVMKGDREKCLAAGATDYLTKPVDTDQLLSVIRKWTTTPAISLVDT